MARMTLSILKQKAIYINQNMPRGYFLVTTQRNGYTAVDLYHEQNMLCNLMCGTPKECGQALSFAYKLCNLKMN